MYQVIIQRMDAGFARIDHLTRQFSTKQEAQAYALALNCKAWTPFYASVRPSVPASPSLPASPASPASENPVASPVNMRYE
jgi:hypothetical protein